MTCLLLDLPMELLHNICLSQTMCSPDGGVSLSLLSRTCTAFGKADKKGGTALVSQWTRQYCKEAGVSRLPLTMGDRWCWPRMLSWLSQAVRVGPQHALKTIKAGVAAAEKEQKSLVETFLAEGSLLVLVEPGVYEEERVTVGGAPESFVSIWRCDRECESKKGEMQKLHWSSTDGDTLFVGGPSSVSLNGLHMSAVKSDAYEGDGAFCCVGALYGAILSFESCDMTSATMLSVLQIGEQSQVRASGCCIHGGQGGGVFIHEGKAILENNDIHSNVEAGVEVTEGEAVLVNNTIRDGHKCGVIICDSSKATLMNNTIVNNDQDGIILQEQASAALAGNTIKGNGLCKVVWTEEDFEARWDEDDIAHYREVHSANGYPGVRVLENSIVNMVGGSNSIEGNGRVANTEQVFVDGSSKAGSEWRQSFDGPDGLHIRECVLALDTLI